MKTDRPPADLESGEETDGHSRHLNRSYTGPAIRGLALR